MKHLPKSTLTEILNDPYGFTYKEMSEVIGEDKARALYAELYKQPFHKKNLSISTKKVYKSSDTEKYVYELNLDYRLYPNTSHIHPHMCG